MKNYILIIFYFCSTLLSLAQPVFTAASIQDISVAYYEVPNYTGVTPGNAGANQTWNYSSLVTATKPFVYLTNVPVVTTPYYNSFPTANYCIKASIEFDNVLYTDYSFARITTTGIEGLGSVSSTGIEEKNIITSFTPLPLNYNDTYIDTYQRKDDTSPTSETETYDAYGTLITPFGTYTNVIRIKTVRNSETSYGWFNINPYTPLMFITVSKNSGLVNEITVVKNSTGLGVNQNSIANTIIVYPNPVTKDLNLQLANTASIDKVIITDMTGKKVLEQTKNTNQIDVESLANGTYIIEFSSENKKFQSKFIKE